MNYEIIGDAFPAVVCNLKAGESMITQSGGMAWMSAGIEMSTSAGGVGKAIGRMFSGESLFLNKYTATVEGKISFASRFPGAIKAFEIKPGSSLIAQKKAFLASTDGVELSIFFQKKIGAGFFGGEGFIMQKLSGNGTAFLEIDGSAIEYNLAAGETMFLDTGYLAAMDETCKMEIEMIKGVKTSFSVAKDFLTQKLPAQAKSSCKPCPSIRSHNRLPRSLQKENNRLACKISCNREFFLSQIFTESATDVEH